MRLDDTHTASHARHDTHNTDMELGSRFLSWGYHKDPRPRQTSDGFSSAHYAKTFCHGKHRPRESHRLPFGSHHSPAETPTSERTHMSAPTQPTTTANPTSDDPRHELHLEHTMVCEKDDAKRDLLMSQYSPKYSFADVSMLGSRMGNNLAAGGARIAIPAVDLFTAGFSCKARSKSNPFASSHLNCLQQNDQSTETCETFNGVISYIEKPSET